MTWHHALHATCVATETTELVVYSILAMQSRPAMQRLPQQVVEQFHASVHITDFPVAVAELVLNAVQASSRNIQVAVNIPQWSVSVSDDGNGISLTALKLLGQRHCTSKPAERGEALSSLAQLSHLQVTSRAVGTFETYKKMVPADCASRKESAPDQITLCALPRQHCGTTVSLSNFLYNQPVRRKQSHGHAAILQEMQSTLHALLLPHTEVDLVLRQEGSTSTVLHMPKGRSLSISLQQYFCQHSDRLHIISTPHRDGWKLVGAAVAPPATFSSKEQQLLYINSRPVTCAALTQLLKDWYLKALRALQASSNNTSGSRMAARTPEPGYVLLVQCPAAAFAVIGRAAGRLEVDFGASMAMLCQLMQEAVGPAWGSMPSAWRALIDNGSNKQYTANAACPKGLEVQRNIQTRRFTQQMGTINGNHRARLQQSQQPGQLVPVHGLHMSSSTRSLAGMQAVQQQLADPWTAAEGHQHHQQPWQQGTAISQQLQQSGGSAKAKVAPHPVRLEGAISSSKCTVKNDCVRGSKRGVSERPATFMKPYSSGRSAQGMQYKTEAEDLPGWAIGSGSGRRHNYLATALPLDTSANASSGRARCAVLTQLESLGANNTSGSSGRVLNTSGAAAAAACGSGRRAATVVLHDSGSSRHRAAGSGGGFRALEAYQPDLQLDTGSAWQKDSTLDNVIDAGVDALNDLPDIRLSPSNRLNASLLGSPCARSTWSELLNPAMDDPAANLLSNSPAHCSYSHYSTKEMTGVLGHASTTLVNDLQLSPWLGGSRWQSNQQRQGSGQAADLDFHSNEMRNQPSQPSLHQQQQWLRTPDHVSVKATGRSNDHHTLTEFLSCSPKQYVSYSEHLPAVGHLLPASPEQLNFILKSVHGRTAEDDVLMLSDTGPSPQLQDLTAGSRRQLPMQQDMLLSGIGPTGCDQAGMHTTAPEDSWHLGIDITSPVITHTGATAGHFHQQRAQTQAQSSHFFNLGDENSALHHAVDAVTSPEMLQQDYLGGDIATVLDQPCSPCFEGVNSTPQHDIQNPFAELPQLGAMNPPAVYADVISASKPFTAATELTGTLDLEMEVLAAADWTGHRPEYSPLQIHGVADTPARSEDTVQQLRAQQQQVKSELPARCTAAAVAVGEPAAAVNKRVSDRPFVGIKDQEHGQHSIKKTTRPEAEPATPTGKQPIALLLPFQQRLLQSAPPVVKTRRIFARSAFLDQVADSPAVDMKASAARDEKPDSNCLDRKVLPPQNAAINLDEATAADTNKQGASAVSPARMTCPNTTGTTQGVYNTKQTRKRRHTYPAMIDDQQAQQAQLERELDSVMQDSPPQQTSKQAAADHAHPRKQQLQEQQSRTPCAKQPLVDVTNTATTSQQQQTLQPLDTAATVSHQLKQLKQSKLPFTSMSGKEAAGSKKVQAEVPWWKKNKQQKGSDMKGQGAKSKDANSSAEVANKLSASKQQAGAYQAADTATLDTLRFSGLKRSCGAVWPAAQACITEAPAVATAASRKRVRFTGIPLSQDSAMQDQQQWQQVDKLLVTQRPSVTAAERSAGTSTDQDCSKNCASNAAADEVTAQLCVGVAGVICRSKDIGSSSLSALTPKARQMSILSVGELEQSFQATCCLVPGRVTRQQLQQAQTISQVSNKIIVVRCGSVLLAIDQHAADERVQLEALQQKLTQQLQQKQATELLTTAASLSSAQEPTPKPDDVLLQRQQLQQPFKLQLGLSEVRAASMYSQQIEHWGWKLQLLGHQTDMVNSAANQPAGAAIGSSCGAKESSGVTTDALLQQVPVLAGVHLGALDLQLYLHQLLETAGSTSQPPPGVVRILKSKACRGAVMFGDELSQQQAVQIVDHLRRTQLCFCCAHGRPTTAPLVDLVALTDRLKQQAAVKNLRQMAVANTTFHRSTRGSADKLRKLLGTTV